MPSVTVVKIGTSSLTTADGALDRGAIARLADGVAGLLGHGLRVVVVTSGAVRAGVEALGWKERPRGVALKQAAAAVGQVRLMEIYTAEFARHRLPVGQVLLTRDLAQDRSRYVNAQNTLETLLRHGALPIVNENDTTAVEELQFGDNDTLASLVAALVKAQTLVLLTNVCGLMDGAGARIPRIERIDDRHRALAGRPGRFGSGGMAAKLQAAEIAGAAGVVTVIAPAGEAQVLERVRLGEDVGTYVAPHPKPLRGRKHWLAYGIQPRGAIVIHPAARLALLERNGSLLPAGVVEVQGPFVAGDSVRLIGSDGVEFARGLAAWASPEVERLAGEHSARVEELLGRSGAAEVVHRDDLVVLPPKVG